MRLLSTICAFGVLFAAAVTVSAQRQMPMGPMGSNVTAAVFHGVFNPTVGSGATYEFDNEGRKTFPASRGLGSRWA